MRAITYARVNRRNARQGLSYLSPVQQEEQTANYVHTRGGVIVDHLFEEDRSGGTLERENLELALATIEAGEADTLVVAKLDRMARTIYGAHSVIARLDAVGARFVSVADSFDLGTPTGRLMFNILASFAEFELDRLRSGWGDVHERNVAMGIATRYPWGYKRGLDLQRRPDDTEGRGLVPTADGRRYIPELFRRRVAGETYGDLARWLNDSGARTRDGNAWSAAGVRHLLANRRFIGEVSYGELVNRHAHEPLIDEPTFLAAQRQPAATVRNGNGFLTGRARCHTCRRALEHHTATPSRPWDVYRHPRSSCAQTVQVKASDLDAYVRGWARNELAAAHVQREGQRVNPAGVDELEQLRRVRDEVAASTDALVRLGVAAHSAQVSELDDRIGAIETELGDAARTPDAVMPTPASFDDLDAAAQRRVIGAMVGAVFVRGLPGRGHKLPVEQRATVVPAGSIATGDLPVRGRTTEFRPWVSDD